MDRKLYDIGVNYHWECEKYDRVVCSVRNSRGVAMPIDRLQMAKINLHARAQLREAINEGEKEGYNKEAVQKAIVETAGVLDKVLLEWPRIDGLEN